jgi:hypothetical protein
MTTEQLNEKAQALASELGFKVHPLAFTNGEGQQILGFLREPTRSAKLSAMDDMMKSPSQAGETILNACLLIEHSDPRILSDDDVYVSATMDCLSILKVYQNDLKKK